MYSLSQEGLEQAISECVESSELVFMHCYAADEEVPADQDLAAHVALLDLQACNSQLSHEEPWRHELEASPPGPDSTDEFLPSAMPSTRGDARGGAPPLHLPRDVLRSLATHVLAEDFLCALAPVCRALAQAVQDVSVWRALPLCLDAPLWLQLSECRALFTGPRCRPILRAFPQVSLLLPQAVLLKHRSPNLRVVWDGEDESVVLYESSHCVLGSLTFRVKLSATPTTMYVGCMCEHRGLEAFAIVDSPFTAAMRVSYFLTGADFEIACPTPARSAAAHGPCSEHEVTFEWRDRSFRVKIDAVRWPWLRVRSGPLLVPAECSRGFVSFVQPPGNEPSLHAQIIPTPAPLNPTASIPCAWCNACMPLHWRLMACCPRCMGFVCCSHAWQYPHARCPVCADLHLGAFWGDASGGSSDAMAPSDESEAECACAEYVQSQVAVGDALLNALKAEVARTIAMINQKQAFCANGRCPLCPFRRFDRRARLVDRLKRYHTFAWQYCPGGTKQMRVIQALFDHKQIAGDVSGISFLADAACLIRSSAKIVTLAQNNVDRHIRLVLTDKGPVYIREFVAAADHFRRVQNLYYDHGFGDLVFQEILLAGGKLFTEPWLYSLCVVVL